ncbi:DUF262 domain-containing protein [Helicobacter pylori]|uniref:DUF262 domain-containing protein n=1 Tax=Helicobacter pylori TaxID=210 RepID=UPI00287BA4FD|nr:DUF262 domain-containing protein [Helicobacter pylori]WNE32561.1 DUF262 domain-containing protein [Helicobacter pylori]WNE33988.1 DUF262 domain-containing protein [Helicobacter pylori]WNE35415.1 DUF262 domain-containing protein [Helicobacter pylori]WNE36842.1 DUF262 domain-containing protein [Helicobacter pylori]WNE38269.1 DUF262 domain-containing protein [Helicobacter pylori]
MANESIKGEAYKLKNILATEFEAYYQIPIYQRPYQWTEKNCEKLLDDLFSSYECYKESDYFCGSLVLIQSDEGNKTYDVVDGQQRLSTFILLAKVLATLYPVDDKYQRYLQESWSDRHENREKKKRKRLDFDLVGSSAKKDFQDTLDFFDDLDASKGEGSKSNDPSKGKNSYLKNAICLKNYLEKKEIENIDDFIQWLYLKVNFITITCSDTDMALRIFNVLNARGLPLHATDIFKGELLKKLTEEKEQEELATRWENLRQKCLDNGFTMETLFSQHLTYLNPVTSKKRMKIRLNTQFDELQKSPLEYLNVVEDFYNAYCEVLEMQDRYAHLLSYKDDDYLCVILCASLLHRYGDQDIEALKKLLVKFYYQHWVARKTKTQREQTCCNIINALKEKKNIDDIISIARKNLGEYSVTQRFKENLRDSLVCKKQSTKDPWIKPILILVEYFISDDPKPKRIQMDENLQVEHILPQNPNLSSQWAKDFSEEERELYTHSLANLTLLGGKINSQASNLDFKDKKKIYMGEEIRLSKKRPFKVMTCYDTTKYIAHHYTEWTPKSLEKRKEELIQIIESVLTL